jgi:hypothetical protein
MQRICYPGRDRVSGSIGGDAQACWIIRRIGRPPDASVGGPMCQLRRPRVSANSARSPEFRARNNRPRARLLRRCNASRRGSFGDGRRMGRSASRGRLWSSERTGATAACRKAPPRHARAVASLTEVLVGTVLSRARTSCRVSGTLSAPGRAVARERVVTTGRQGREHAKVTKQ